MGKTSKWLRNFLTGKKDKEKEKSPSNHIFSTSSEYPATPISIRHNPKEKKRWSFRRSSAAAAVSVSSSDSFPFPLEMVSTIMPVAQAAMDVNYGENKKQGLDMDMDYEEKRQAVAMVVVKAAAADAAVAAAAATRLTEVAYVKATAFEEAAAIKIQSVFRSYLARKALRALRGLVKLQALARGHLVRKQAKATLRCMQALITAQARARAQRIRMIEATNNLSYQRQSFLVESVNEDHFGYANHVAEENIKIVEMDHGEYKRGSKNRTIYVADQQHEHTYPTNHVFATHQVPSSLTNINRRGCSSHFEDYSISTVQSSPQDYLANSKPDPSKSSPICFPTSDCIQSLSFEYPMFPSYMANTESSRAKARSQSAPKTRPESFERQPSRRKASTEGKNIPKAMQIQRSSSLVGCATQDLQYPLLIKLDKSTNSLNNSECGSTSTVLTHTNYRSLVTCEGNGNGYY